MSGRAAGLRSRATRFLPNKKENIRNLSPDIALKIRRSLDTAPQDRNWRAFVAAMVDKFPFSQQEVEHFGMAVNRANGSPCQMLMDHLASRDFRVRDLIKYLDALGWEYLLQDLKPYEKIKVLSWPKEKVKLLEGDTVTLSVSATGFPYPRYQWFKGNDEIPGATESTLMVPDVSQSDTGSYSCRIHNSSDQDLMVFTLTSVNVAPNPRKAAQRPREDSWPPSIPTVPAEPCPRDFVTPVGQAPRILDQSSDVTVSMGDPIMLSVSAIGAQPLKYCWFKNGSPEPNEMKSSQQYKVDHASLVDSGSYECQVENQYGQVKSKVISVRVVLQPTTRMPTCTLDIISHPKSCAVEKGGSALFFCGAVGEMPISYQWYKDGRPMPGETRHELAIREVKSYDQEGSFQCRVWNRSLELISNGAFLRLDLDVPMIPSNVGTIHTATDKIALLIGNYDYSGTDLLKAPKVDVQVMAELLRSMDFKVVSLLNLTLGEMVAAVEEFCSLLKSEGQGNSGVYGLFYFCGHGTEEKGQCYLVPQDAPTGYSSSNCLCAQKVVQQMQDANAALCTMILDCCRIKSDNPPETPLDLYVPRPSGNVIYLYATTLGMRAYEFEKRPEHMPLGHLLRKQTMAEVNARVTEEPDGVLVKHLRKHLCRRKPVEAVFAEVRRDISNDPKVKKYQIPEVNTNLVEPERSLADKIVYSGQTEVFNKRTELWRNAHVKPENHRVHIKHLGVTVNVEYYADFSNVLSIVLTVTDPGTTKDCHAWIVNLPLTLSVMDMGKLSNSPVTTKIVLQDLQKLKEPLTLTIDLQYRNESRENCSYQHEPIHVGFPLISTLALWKGERNQVMSHRVPTEHYQGDEPPQYANFSPNYVNAPPSHLGISPQGSIRQTPFPSCMSSVPSQPPSSCPSKDVQYVNITDKW